MKLFREENGKRVVYVTIESMQVIAKYIEKVPTEILFALYNDSVVNEMDLSALHRFSQKGVVEFMEQCDKIIDYDIENKKSIDEIIANYMEAISLAETWDHVLDKSGNFNGNIEHATYVNRQCALTQYRMGQYAEIAKRKTEKRPTEVSEMEGTQKRRVVRK